MKQYTKEELEAIVNKVMKDTFNVCIEKQTNNELLFEATHMYDWDSYTPNFKQMLEFVSEFNTSNIDKYDDISESGCDTCDYGSKYGFAMRVWE